MDMTFVRAGIKDAEKLREMQAEAFRELYARYRDTDTSPATEKTEKILARLKQPCTFYYFIRVDGADVGVIRVVDHQQEGMFKRISPLFIMPPFRGRGYAQAAIRMAEELHGPSCWELDTILQEEGNCYLYEKMGYRQTGEMSKINDKMTLVIYRKM